MEHHTDLQSKRPQGQSGKQIAFGILAFVIGTIALMMLLKAITG